MTSIAQVHAEGRLTRNQWSGTDAEGRELLCLYTALAGDSKARPETCPAHLAPKWLARLLPAWDDNGTLDAWPGMVARVVELAPRFGELTGRRERVALAGVNLATLNVAREHAGEGVEVVDAVRVLWTRVLAGDEPAASEWRAAARAAYAADAAANAAANAAAAYAAYADAASTYQRAWDRITAAHLDVIEAALNT